MINRLLRINDERFMSKTDKGERFYNSLKAYQQWEQLYLKYSKHGSSDKNLTEFELKKLLLIGYISRQNSDAAMSEAFSSDLIAIFNQNRANFLAVIADLNFLIPSTCYFLGNYFGFEGKNQQEQQTFLTTNKSFIIEALGESDGDVCIEYFK